MIRIITIAAAVAALATPVLAEGVTVSLVGKAPNVIQSEVAAAASHVCAAESALAPWEQEACVRDTIAKTMAKINQQPTLQ